MNTNTTVANLTTANLERLLGLRKQIEALEIEITGILTGTAPAKTAKTDATGKVKRVLSVEARAKIAEGQRARREREAAAKAAPAVTQPVTPLP
jgi:hypothetical protein